MRVLKKLLIGLVVLVVLVVVVGLFLPGEIRIDRRVDIQAAPQQIHLFVNNLKRWPEWVPWNTAIDPTLKYTYEGPEAGAGAVSKWTAEKLGNGVLKIESSDPTEGVEYQLSFDDGATWSSGALEYEAKADLTTVTWSADIDCGMNLLFRYVLFFYRDQMESEFDQGLEKLKVLAERTPAPAAIPQPAAAGEE